TFLTATIGGLSTAAIYAITASGLVVTYTTSGVFNFAHGAFSMMAAFAYWQLHVAWGLPTPVAIILVVFVLAPIFGGAIERVIMRGIEGTAEVVKIVVTVSLFVALLGLAQVIWPPTEDHTVLPFFNNAALSIFGVKVGWARLVALVVAVAVAVGLRFVFRSTRLGVAMRAVVDDRALLQLNGGRPGRTSMLSWAIGASLAAIAGVLLAGEQTLSATTLSLLVINAYAAAVVGRLRSLPGVFLGSAILGLLVSYGQQYIASDAAIHPFGLTVSLGGAVTAIPAVMLFAVMVWQPQDRLQARGATRVPTALRMPSMRLALWGGLAFVLVTAALGSLMDGADLFKVAGGYLFALVMLSLVPLTGYAGQISLAQMTFTGLGAVAMASWGATGSPLALVASVLLCAVVGAVVALPALRLSGIYLALATAAFGLFCSAMVFNQQGVMPGLSRQVPRLALGPLKISSDYQQLLLLAVAFAGVGIGLVALRRSSWGRRLAAMKDSPVACATLGLNLTATKVAVFALSAAIAGLAGSLAGRTFISDEFGLPASLPVTMLAVVGGIGSVAGAFIGGLAWGAFPIASTVFAANAVGVFKFFSMPVADFVKFAPGVTGVSLGREPDGAAPQIAAGFRAVGESTPALVVSFGGAATLWLLARLDLIGGWSFTAALLVFTVAVVPVLPLLFHPEDMGRKLAASIWLGLCTVVTAFLPWDTMIRSN
ncbi:MAG: ABC transporter permease, partial [Actinomycetes bacterium]